MFGWNKNSVTGVHPQRQPVDRYLPFGDERLAKGSAPPGTSHLFSTEESGARDQITGQIALRKLNKNRSQLYL
uniref:hypothetical protein n=1 Tax=Burkholderia sp. M701 TaxID=326454 RepID=UPI00159EC030|nr:hypothetical protein [Burkholderia sp. M701]